jgi:hypothetical protein
MVHDRSGFRKWSHLMHVVELVSTGQVGRNCAQAGRTKSECGRSPRIVTDDGTVMMLTVTSSTITSLEDVLIARQRCHRSGVEMRVI